jgi:hypothetical protein
MAWMEFGGNEHNMGLARNFFPVQGVAHRVSNFKEPIFF